MDLDDAGIDDLERKARAATTQDQWQWRPGGEVLEGRCDGTVAMYCHQADGDEFEDAAIMASVGDRAHIAAASPPVVLALIAKIRSLRIELAATRRMADAASLELSNARVAHQEEIGLAAEVELRLVEAREADAAEAAAVYEAMRAEVDALRCGDLDAYRDGELSEERRAAFEAHLVGCKACEAGLLDWMQIEGVASAPARKP